MRVQGYRLQLALFGLQGAESAEALEAQLARVALLPATQARLRSQREAAQANIAELTALLEPLVDPDVTEVDEAAAAPDPHALPPLLQYFELLLRDWSWSDAECDENARALALARRHLPERPGHLLVLGAGAGRLAYDVHRACAPASTTTVDLDLLLAAVARRMADGGQLALTEAPSDVNGLAGLRERRVLRAPGGPVTGLRVLLADGLQAPFHDGAFDAVLTPWFVDQVPDDLRGFVGEIGRLLRPGGIWVNQGPLIYRKGTPPACQYTIEEVVELARLAGFDVGPVSHEDGRYLCSPLKGRGRFERVFAFRATRLERAPEELGGTPSWLVLSHLPVPRVPGADLRVGDTDAVAAVLALADGTRSLAAIARALAERTGMAVIDLEELVRAVLRDHHPALARQ